jgi:hypothetical protein
MTKKVFFIRDEKILTAEIDPMPDWDGFDKLINYLEINYQTKILGSFDGPGARRWILEVNEKIIELIHDDGYGNYFKAPTVDSEDIVREIGADLEERLQGIEE